MPRGIYTRTESHKQKQAKAMMGKPSGMFGKKHSKSAKEKIGKSALGRPNVFKGKQGLNKGKHWKVKDVTKMRKAAIGNIHGFQRGEKHFNWQGGRSKDISFYKRQRRMRKLGIGGIGGSHTKAEWQTLKAQYNWTCPCCKKREPEIKLTADHIIPIIKGGSDNIENIQPLCRSCNSKKYIKIIKFVL